MSLAAGMMVEGTLYLNRKDTNGALTGIKKVIGVTQLELKVSSDIKEQISKDKGSYGAVTAIVAVPKPTELSLTVANFDRDSLAMAVMGDNAVVTSGGGTVTAEDVTAKLGTFVPLAHRNITAASVVVTNTGATVTYVEGTDYEINYALGMIEAKATITDAQAIKVTYAYGAMAGYKVNAGTVTQVKGALVLDGRNLADNSAVIITIPSALLTSDSAIDFMSDKFVEFKMKGRAEVINGAPAVTIENVVLS
jgi:hypothetical protein